MSNLSEKLVSVVIPTRNRKKKLSKAIDSVRKQTWKNIELIIIDDSSTDETKNYLQDLIISYPDLKVIHNESPVGGAQARNLGIEISNGSFIAFLDDDDIWLPKKIENQMNLIMNDSGVAAVSCWFYIENEIGRIRLKKLRSPSSKQEILEKNHLGGASVCLTKKSYLNKIGGFDKTLQSGQDWDLWLKLLAVGRLEICEEPLVVYLSHNDQRITNDLRASYLGRKKIYFRYKKQMDSKTKLKNLIELLYLRRVALPFGFLRKLFGLISVLKVSNSLEKFRYFYRFIRREIFLID